MGLYIRCKAITVGANEVVCDPRMSCTRGQTVHDDVIDLSEEGI